VPDENEQKEIYENIARKINPLVTTIRAFDIGGDKVKVVDFPEANPFLGLRGVRFLLENPSIYKKQIRAALRANSAGNIHFMIPMVATVEEITRTKELIAECVNELQSGGIPCYPNMKLGIMIEVPSAALLIKDLAHEVDFFSIGTNDLIQYLLAVDRGNDAVAELYQEFHPSVLRTLEHIIRLSDEAEIPVSLCGEMAADNLALPILIGLGLRSLSASPAALLSLKRTIRSVSYEHCRKLAAECLAMRSSSQVAEHINAFFEEHQIPRTRTILHFD
jgi:phosphotransferase system enzyme I (PtsI)